jgi:serine/threonine protein kinase
VEQQIHFCTTHDGTRIAYATVGEGSADREGGELATHLKDEPAPLTEFVPNIPPELLRIVRKALTKDCDSRYQTARDMMIDLKNLRRDLDIQSELKRSRN